MRLLTVGKPNIKSEDFFKELYTFILMYICYELGTMLIAPQFVYVNEPGLLHNRPRFKSGLLL